MKILQILKSLVAGILVVVGGFLAWAGNEYSWVYQKNDPDGGMYIGLLGAGIIFLALLIFPFRKREKTNQ